jgi:hypothetical protein
MSDRRAVLHVRDLAVIDTFQFFGPSDTPDQTPSTRSGVDLVPCARPLIAGQHPAMGERDRVERHVGNRRSSG